MRRVMVARAQHFLATAAMVSLAETVAMLDSSVMAEQVASERPE